MRRPDDDDSTVTPGEAIAWTVGAVGVMLYLIAIAFRLFSLGQDAAMPDIWP